ncbi:TOBE domain protein [compost metagenome]
MVTSHEVQVSGLLRDIQYQGSATRFELQLDSGQLLAVSQANDRWQAQAHPWQPGQRVQAHWPREAMTVLQETEAR